jgi:hypothetical protein
MEKEIEELSRRLTSVETTLARLAELLEERADVGTTLMAPFRIVDDSGRTVLEIEAREDSCFLHLINGSGEPVATLSSGVCGGELDLYDEQGGRVAVLAATDDGAALDLQSRTGHQGIELVSAAGGGRAEIHDEAGNRVVTLATHSKGGELSVRDTGENRAAVLWVTRDGGELTLYNSARQIMAAIGAEENGGRVWLLDEIGRRTFPWLAWGGLMILIYLVQRLVAEQRASDLWAYLGTVVLYSATVAAQGGYVSVLCRGIDDSEPQRVLWSQQSRLHWPVTLGTAILPGIWIGVLAKSPVLMAAAYFLTVEAVTFVTRLFPRPRPWALKPHVEALLFKGLMMGAAILVATFVRRLIGW